MSLTRGQPFRLTATQTAPGASTRLPGELWTNFPDLQIGLIDSGKNAQKLVAVRYFSANANYSAGDFVVQGGVIYAANTSIAAGAFNGSQWSAMLTSATMNSALANYLQLIGGTLSGPLILAADPTANLGAVTKQYVDAHIVVPPSPSNVSPIMNGIAATGSVTAYARGDHVHPTDTTCYAASNPAGYQTAGQVAASLGGYLALAGGAMLGPLALAAGPVNPLDAATKAYVDQGGSNIPYLPLAGGVLSGPLTIDGVAGAPRSVLGSTHGAKRWELQLGGVSAETGSNAGSDFNLIPYSDAGASLGTAFIIQRSSGAVFINGQGATSAALFSPTAANLTINKSGAGSLANLNGANNGLLRWQINLGNATLETGGNVGSGFAINRFSDAGALIDQPLQISRSTGVASFLQPIINGPSDRSLKDNIEPLEDALAKIEALQGVSYTWKTNGRRDIGLIAQDVEPVVPEVVQEFTSGDGAKLKALDYPKLVALLIEAVKTLSARVSALEGA